MLNIIFGTGTEPDLEQISCGYKHTKDIPEGSPATLSSVNKASTDQNVENMIRWLALC